MARKVDDPTKPFRPGPVADLLGWLLLPALALVVAGIWGTVAAPSAYGYSGADIATVTVAPGSTCETLISRRGGGGTDCPATWTVDGQVVHGEITTHHGGDLPRAGEPVEAHVWGHTASTDYDERDLRWGLAGPYLLVGGVLAITVLLWAQRRATVRSVRRRLEDQGELSWYPFVLRRDGLAAGAETVPWAQVDDVAREGRGKVKVVRLTLAGETVRVPEPAYHPGAFVRFVRQRAAEARG